MACFRPVTAYKPDDGGPIVFFERKGYREIQLPCGQCIGCRIRKRDEWAIRCLCESKLHRHNHFLTLTYDDANVPDDYSLDYRHFQLFMKRMRKRFGPFRFFMCGEYGEQFWRPHYHALLFGLDIPDLRKCNSVFSQHDVFSSETLGKLWGKGSHSIGSVTYESARYCAVYATKRVTGDRAEDHYERVSPVTGEFVSVAPEFAHMSLRPGIGAKWLESYWRDVYVSGAKGVVVKGKPRPIPRYFDGLMRDVAQEVMEAVDFDRYLEAQSRSVDNTRERLAVREEVAISRQRFNRERFGNEV